MLTVHIVQRPVHSNRHCFHGYVRLRRRSCRRRSNRSAAGSWDGSTYWCQRMAPLQLEPSSWHGKLWSMVNVAGVAQDTSDSMPSALWPVTMRKYPMSPAEQTEIIESRRPVSKKCLLKRAFRALRQKRRTIVLSPGIANDPILFSSFVIHTPAHKCNDVVSVVESWNEDK